MKEKNIDISKVVLDNLCLSCGLCYKVCSGVLFNKSLRSKRYADPFVGKILSSEVGKATSHEIFMNSKSGGVATALISYLFKQKKSMQQLYLV